MFVCMKIFLCFVQHLAATRTYANLDVPLCDVLDALHDHHTYQLATCKKTDQLFELMDRFVTREVNYPSRSLNYARRLALKDRQKETYSTRSSKCSISIVVNTKEDRLQFSSFSQSISAHCLATSSIDLGSSLDRCEWSSTYYWYSFYVWSHEILGIDLRK